MRRKRKESERKRSAGERENDRRRKFHGKKAVEYRKISSDKVSRVRTTSRIRNAQGFLCHAQLSSSSFLFPRSASKRIEEKEEEQVTKFERDRGKEEEEKRMVLEERGEESNGRNKRRREEEAFGIPQDS